LGDEGASAIFTFRWEGLTDRTLRRWQAHIADWFDLAKKTCHQDSVTSQYEKVSIKDVTRRLPEIVQEITKPLYKAFDLYKPSIEDVRREVAKMMKNVS